MALIYSLLSILSPAPKFCLSVEREPKLSSSESMKRGNKQIGKEHKYQTRQGEVTAGNYCGHLEGRQDARLRGCVVYRN